MLKSFISTLIVAVLISTPVKADCIRNLARFLDEMNDKRESYQEGSCEGRRAYLGDLEKVTSILKGCKKADPEGVTVHKTTKSIEEVKKSLIGSGCELP